MARRVRVRGTKRQVWSGTRQKTVASGHTKALLMKNKSGKIVTKKSHAAGVRAYKNIRGWTQAVSKARKALGITGFCAVKKGTPLYIKAREFYCVQIAENVLEMSASLILCACAAQLNARPLSPPSVTKH